MNTALAILWYVFIHIWILIAPLDMICVCNHSLRIRLMRGWVRRRLIRRYGPLGPSNVRICLWVSTCIPAMPLIFIHAVSGLVLLSIYWIIIGIMDLVDFLTSWDDPPWRKARKWASARIQQLLQDMGERSRAPGIPQPVRN